MEITDQEHKELAEKAGRADAAEQRAREAEAELATHRRRSAAEGILEAELAKEQGVSFSKLERVGLLADLPVKESELDADAFAKVVTEAVTERKASLAEGSTSRPKGFGESVPDGDTTKSTKESGSRTRSAWGRSLSEKAS